MLAEVLTSATDGIAGCHKYEAIIKLKQNLEADVQADYDATTLAESIYQQAIADQPAFYAAFQTVDDEVAGYLGVVRKRIAMSLGERWTPAWAGAGFTNKTTAVPAAQAGRQTLLNALKKYFADHPGMEVNTIELVITAVKCQLLFAALGTARTNAEDGEQDIATKKIARDAALAALRHRLMGLVSELEQLLGPLDPRWLSFGLNKPGATNLPGAVTDLALTAGTPGTVLAAWGGGARATHFRVFQQVAGVDVAPVFVTNVNDPNYNFTGLPSGKKVTVTLYAANDAGQSAGTSADSVVP